MHPEQAGLALTRQNVLGVKVREEASGAGIRVLGFSELGDAHEAGLQRGRQAYFSVAAMSDGKPFYVDWDADWAAIERRRRELPEGFHPTSFDIYRRGDELRYAAVWTRDEVPVPWQLHLDMDVAGLQQKIGELATNKYRPAVISTYRGLDDGARFLAVFVEDGAPCETLFDLDQDDLQAKLDALDQSWYPAWLEAYVVDGRRRYAAIFLSDGRTLDWKVSLGKSATEINQRINEIRGSGFWPARQTNTIDPATPQPALKRAELLESFRRSDEALAELNDAVERLPDRHELLVARAKILERQGDIAAADASYAAALRLQPQNESLWLARGKLLAEGDTTTVVPAGSTWNWLHPTDGVDPAAREAAFQRSFFKADYDDSNWQTGKDGTGGFGYGEPRGVAVNIGFPPVGQRYTAYFRHRFTTEQPLKNLVLNLQRDDGVIVYLDGVEVARDNMRAGPDAYDLLADENITQGADERRTINVPLVDVLAPGEHLLAISLHNRSAGSGDLRIEHIELRGQLESTTTYEVADAGQLNARGAYYQQQGDLRNAEADYTAALANEPDDATVALRRARLLASQFRWSEAIADFDVAVRRRPNDADLLVERALAHGRLGKRTAALADLTAATRLRPDDIQFRRQQGQLYALLDSNMIVPPATRWTWLHPIDGVDPATSDPDFHKTFARGARNVPQRPGDPGGAGRTVPATRADRTGGGRLYGLSRAGARRGAAAVRPCANALRQQPLGTSTGRLRIVEQAVRAASALALLASVPLSLQTQTLGGCPNRIDRGRRGRRPRRRAGERLSPSRRLLGARGRIRQSRGRLRPRASGGTRESRQLELASGRPHVRRGGAIPAI